MLRREFLAAVTTAAAAAPLLAQAPRRRAVEQPPAHPGRPGRSPVLKTEFGDVEIFPADNAWNVDVSELPVHPDSDAYIASIGRDKPLHPDFGTVWQGAPNGIPYMIVPGNQERVPVAFQYARESDAGPYPIPADAAIEGGPDGRGDRHVLVIDAENKRLYELFKAYPAEPGWKAGSGAIFDLAANSLRPAGWTSADAAGLPIFPGLVRYEEAVEQEEIRHALRFTVAKTRRAYIFPARHFASRSNDAGLPPMGLRLRLKGDFDVSRHPRCAQVILRALQVHGMLLADNGSNWFLSGAPHPKWNDDELRSLKRVTGDSFEAVRTGELVTR